MLLVVAGGMAAFVDGVGRVARLQEQRELEIVAVTAAASINPDQVNRLGGNAGDIGGAVLQDVRRRLQRIRDVNPQVRFVYLMRPGAGRFIFLADAEAETSPDYSPPGQVYDDQIEGLQRVMASALPVVEDPYEDRWGRWVSALAPIVDPQTGAVIAVLGIDVSAEHWQQALRQHYGLALAIAMLASSVFGLLWFGAYRHQRNAERLAGLNDALEAELAHRRLSDQRLKLAAAVLTNTGDGVMVADARGIIESVNAAFERITLHSAQQAVGRNLRMLYSARNSHGLFRSILQDLQRNGRWDGQIWSRRRNGERYPQEVSVSVLRDDDGVATHYAAIFRDKTDQHRLEQRLNELAQIDGLTGIPNRRHFDASLAAAFERARQDNAPISMLMADLDFFKRFNDRYGHIEGDECLKRIAQRIRSVVRNDWDMAARYGGEEFAMILPGTVLEDALRVAQRLNEAIRAMAIPNIDSGVAPIVTISIGCATVIPSETMVARDLIAQADAALYSAKREGRDRVVAAN
ncbi:sensor domain-containing diguanylate cyclase [Sinimarinibacterium sp. CAU 1509]|uniref:sensor domain-containing diguanylate cyclase n=1 Tax=Sinimarinibacterium sp. CAU 1509 TaxID=2562283 RepID=UPI00146ABFBE|nr:diguanylate cyclase [Sinimarinibacterium sp. CAU 1509]